MVRFHAVRSDTIYTVRFVMVRQGMEMLRLLEVLDPWLAVQMFVNPKLRAAVTETPLRVCVPVCSLELLICTVLLLLLLPYCSTLLLAAVMTSRAVQTVLGV